MKRTILCIDDSNVIKSLVRSYLEENYEVVSASNGKEGLEKLQELFNQKTNIALILCDIGMEVMSGPDFIQEIKKNPNFKFIPVIVMTSEQESHSKYRFMYNSWIDKKFDKESLLNVVNKVLNPIEYMKSQYPKP